MIRQWTTWEAMEAGWMPLSDVEEDIEVAGENVGTKGTSGTVRTTREMKETKESGMDALPRRGRWLNEEDVERREGDEEDLSRGAPIISFQHRTL
jgi:hypothetical protein